MKQINVFYRSLGFLKGSTDHRAHFHIDLPEKEIPKLFKIIKKLENLGFKSSIDQVLVSIGGPQRLEIVWMYDLHNVPGDTDGGETFGAFSSTVIESVDELVFAIRSITPELLKIKAGIIEAEHPVGLYNKNGWELIVPNSDYMQPVKPGKIGLAVKKSMRFETHHWASVPKDLPLIDLRKLNEFLAKRKVKIGGLFIMDGVTSWGYASNSFSDDEDFQKRIEIEYDVWRSFFIQENLPCEDI